FADTHVRVGLLPGWGVSQRLARQIGLQRAKEISFSGRFLTAERALEVGLVNRVVPAQELMAETLELAHEIAGHRPEIVQAYKSTSDDGYAMALPEALAMEHARSVAHITSLTTGELDGARRDATARQRSATRG